MPAKQKEKWDFKRYRIEDVFQTAVSIEEGGYEFYDQLIGTSDETGVKNELAFLRDEEAGHREIFENHLRKRGITPGGKLPDGMRRLLEEEFLGPMKELYSGGKINKSSDTLRFGLVLEQKTIDFYGALKEHTQDETLRKDLDTVIEEEKRHKMKLNLFLSY